MSEAMELVDKFIDETEDWAESIGWYLDELMDSFRDELYDVDEGDADKLLAVVRRRNVLEVGVGVMVSRLLDEFKASASAVERRLEAMGEAPKSEARRELDRFWLRMSRELSTAPSDMKYGKFASDLYELLSDGFGEDWYDVLAKSVGRDMMEAGDYTAKGDNSIAEAEQAKLMAGFVEYHKTRERDED